jgi:hypothetical protein
MNIITILVIGYLLTSALCASATICACIISARTKDAKVRVVRATDVRRSSRSVFKDAHAH